MASFHHLPPPVALEGTQLNIPIILPYPAMSKPSNVSTSILVPAEVGIASTNKIVEGGLQGKMTVKDSMSQAKNADKDK